MRRREAPLSADPSRRDYESTTGRNLSEQDTRDAGPSGLPKDSALLVRPSAELAAEPGDPPVVARMVVEIRSDGLRTIARGALQDLATGQSVAVRAEGASPMTLAASLAKSLFSLPVLSAPRMTRQVFRRWLGGRKNSP